MLSVPLSAAGIMPSANNRFPPPKVIGNSFGPERIDQIMLEERLKEICASANVQSWASPAAFFVVVYTKG